MSSQCALSSSSQCMVNTCRILVQRKYVSICCFVIAEPCWCSKKLRGTEKQNLDSLLLIQSVLLQHYIIINLLAWLRCGRSRGQEWKKPHNTEISVGKVKLHMNVLIISDNKLHSPVLELLLWPLLGNSIHPIEIRCVNLIGFSLLRTVRDF